MSRISTSLRNFSQIGSKISFSYLPDFAHRFVENVGLKVCVCSTAVRNYSLTASGTHVLCEVTFPLSLQPKLVLDLVTPEGCKAELTSLHESGFTVDRTSVLNITSPKFYRHTNQHCLYSAKFLLFTVFLEYSKPYFSYRQAKVTSYLKAV